MLPATQKRIKSIRRLWGRQILPMLTESWHFFFCFYYISMLACCDAGRPQVKAKARFNHFWVCFQFSFFKFSRAYCAAAIVIELHFSYSSGRNSSAKGKGFVRNETTYYCQECFVGSSLQNTETNILTENNKKKCFQKSTWLQKREQKADFAERYWHDLTCTPVGSCFFNKGSSENKVLPFF